jgi:hypothetical protein
MRDALERAMSPPFRNYYEWVAENSLACANREGIKTIVELGAGPAQITKRLAGALGSSNLHLIVCDVDPDRGTFTALERAYPGKVKAIHNPVDFRDSPVWPPDALIVVSGALHHVPRENRGTILKQWISSAQHVLVFEPLQQNIASVAFAALSFVPGLLMPVIQWKKPGRTRRILWSWLIPLAPFMFAWDGIVSALRQWTKQEWEMELQRHFGSEKFYAIKRAGFCLMVSCAGNAQLQVSSEPSKYSAESKRES